jgi:hypothetical protein
VTTAEGSRADPFAVKDELGRSVTGDDEGRLRLEQSMRRLMHGSQAVPGADLLHLRFPFLHCEHAEPNFIARGYIDNGRRCELRKKEYGEERSRDFAEVEGGSADQLRQPVNYRGVSALSI